MPSGGKRDVAQIFTDRYPLEGKKIRQVRSHKGIRRKKKGDDGERRADDPPGRLQEQEHQDGADHQVAG